jgi:hypothetical protein
MNLTENIKNLATSQQITFCENILFQTTIAIRDVWADETTTADQKVEAMKWQNEFTHRVHNFIFTLKNNCSKNQIEDLLADAKHYSAYSPIAKGNIAWILKSAFEKTNDLSNENIPQLYKYKITTDKTNGSFSLSKYDAGLPTNEDVLFVFEADNYNKAAAIYNQFNGFEMYIPMSENIICERDLEISKNGIKIKDAKIIIYQAQKMQAGEWKCDYQIIGINEDRIFGICGVDSFQAVQEANKVIENHLEIFRRDNPELTIDL